MMRGLAGIYPHWGIPPGKRPEERGSGLVLACSRTCESGDKWRVAVKIDTKWRYFHFFQLVLYVRKIIEKDWEKTVFPPLEANYTATRLTI